MTSLRRCTHRGPAALRALRAMRALHATTALHALQPLHATTAITATTRRLPLNPGATASSVPVTAPQNCTPLTAELLGRVVSARDLDKQDFTPPSLAVTRLPVTGPWLALIDIADVTTSHRDICCSSSRPTLPRQLGNAHALPWLFFSRRLLVCPEFFPSRFFRFYACKPDLKET